MQERRDLLKAFYFPAIVVVFFVILVILAEGRSNDFIVLLEVFPGMKRFLKMMHISKGKALFKNRHYAITCSLGFWGSHTAAWPTVVCVHFSKWLLRKIGHVHLLAFCGCRLLAALVFCGVTENTVGAFFRKKVRRKRRGCDWS